VGDLSLKGRVAEGNLPLRSDGNLQFLPFEF
jgi:hypothetical protein